MPTSRAPLRSCWLVAVPSGAFLACTLPLAANAGNDAGVPSQTVGDRCAAMFAEVCDRQMTHCGDFGSLSDCIAANMPTCCTGTLCNAISKVSPATAAACKQRIDIEECFELSTTPIPDACQGVLHQP